MKKKNKIRVNISVNSELLKKAKTKMYLFGGKLSTLFDAYLKDFVDSMEKDYGENRKEILEKIDLLDKRLKKLEDKNYKHDDKFK